jgi:hypothetical protein
MEVAENLMLAPIRMRFPGGQLPNPADITGGPGRAPNRSLLASAYRVFPTAIGLKEAARARNWNTLLDPPEAVSTEPELPAASSWNMESSRMAIIEKGPWQVYFHYGQLDRSHAQAEALNYEVFFENVDLTHDPGTVGYGSPLHRGYYTTGIAHNVPLVDGQGQEGWDAGELVAFEADQGRVAARQPRYRKDAVAERELRIDGAQLIDRVSIKTSGDTPRRIGLAVHVQGKVNVPGAAEPADGFPHWKETKSWTASDRAQIPVTMAGGRMVLLVFETAGTFKVMHGSAPDVPPARRDALYFEVSGTSAEFRTTWKVEASTAQ